MAKMLPRPPAPRDRGYLVSPTSRQRDSSRTSIGGELPVSQSRRNSARAVNSQQRIRLGAGLDNTKQEVLTGNPKPVYTIRKNNTFGNVFIRFLRMFSNKKSQVRVI
jgi:hypothetical protein